MEDTLPPRPHSKGHRFQRLARVIALRQAYGRRGMDRQAYGRRGDLASELAVHAKDERRTEQLLAVEPDGRLILVGLAR